VDLGRASAILRLAGNFLSNDKKSPKNVFFSPIGPVREWPSLATRGPRASCARSPSIQTARDRYKESCKSALHKAKAVRLHEQDLFLLGLPALALCPWGYKILDISRAQACSEGDRAQGCARSATSSTDVLFADNIHGEQEKSFFGDFLPISKKLPASRRIAEAPLPTPRKPHTAP
jgi:hypothetical protein